MNLRSKEQGFTLIELLLVVVIIGILLAVIVPRAWRANVDAKYGLVRQNCTELASFASQWAEQMMEAQDMDSEARLVAYYNSLIHGGTGSPGNTLPGGNNTWIANVTNSNWNNDAARVTITGRDIAGTETDPEAAVEDLVPPERLPRNPFTGASVFRDDPVSIDNVIPGSIASGGEVDQGWYYYALVFSGTDSTETAFTNDDSFHAGMGTSTIAGLRNGIFMARLAP